MTKTFQLYARVLRWVDGDTFVGILDQSCFIYQGTEAKPRRFRCALINTPELKVDGQPNVPGIAAAEYAAEIAPPGEYMCISTGLDEYGRPLLDLVTDKGRFSERMIASGHAEPYRRSLE